MPTHLAEGIIFFMDKLIKDIKTELPLTVCDVADLFSSMDNFEQAEFLNKVAENVKEWKTPFCFQLQSVCDTELLTEDAKRIMKEIGDYSDGLSFMKAKELGL